MIDRIYAAMRPSRLLSSHRTYLFSVRLSYVPALGRHRFFFGRSSLAGGPDAGIDYSRSQLFRFAVATERFRTEPERGSRPRSVSAILGWSVSRGNEERGCDGVCIQICIPHVS